MRAPKGHLRSAAALTAVAVLMASLAPAGAITSPHPLLGHLMSWEPAPGDLQAPLLLAAFVAGEPAQRAPLPMVQGDLGAAVRALYAATNIPTSADLLADLDTRTSPLDSTLAAPLATLLTAITHAHLVAKATIRGPGDFDRPALVAATLNVLAAIEATRPIFEASAMDPANAKEWLFQDPHGIVALAGTLPNHHAGNHGIPGWNPLLQVLTIDLGGDDTYTNTAGGIESCPQAQGSDAVCVAAATVSVAVDLGGDDAYYGSSSAQGSGKGGIGLLVDTNGNDAYAGTISVSQGAGDTGIGMLLDLSGNDHFETTFRGQGYGMDGGFGILVDREGNDTFTAGPVVQGAGEYFGLGFLADLAGTDSYSAGYPSSTSPAIAQGSSLANAIGLLFEAGGADTYFANGGGAQGYVMNGVLTAGFGGALFFDREGIDQYLNAPMPGNDKVWIQGKAGVGIDTDGGGVTLGR